MCAGGREYFAQKAKIGRQCGWLTLKAFDNLSPGLRSGNPGESCFYGGYNPERVASLTLITNIATLSELRERRCAV